MSHIYHEIHAEIIKYKASWHNLDTNCVGFNEKIYLFSVFTIYFKDVYQPKYSKITKYKKYSG